MSYQLDQHVFLTGYILREFASIAFFEQRLLSFEEVDPFLRSLALPARAGVDYAYGSAQREARVWIERIVYPAEIGVSAIGICHTFMVSQNTDCVIGLIAGRFRNGGG